MGTISSALRSITKHSSSTRWADPSVVEAASEQWSDNYLECRSYGHMWKPHTLYRAGQGLIVIQRCPRCKNKRECEMDSRGYATPWKMKYDAHGYLLEGMGRVNTDGRAILRLAAVRHLKIMEAPDEEI